MKNLPTKKSAGPDSLTAEYKNNSVPQSIPKHTKGSNTTKFIL
jgi:hypothetical protein